VVQEVEFKCRPGKFWCDGQLLDDEITDKALEISGESEGEILSWPDPIGQYNKFKATLERFVNRYTKTDKFVLAGYNVNFDDQFLREWFKKAGDKYYGSYFFWPKRDVQTYLSEHIAEHGLRLPDYKLETVCNHFQIPIEAHDAMSDIKATRSLYQVLRYSISRRKDNA